MNQNKLPPGWDEERIQRVLTHYERQTEADAVLEDAAMFKKETNALIEIPVELLPVVRELLASYYGGREAMAM